MKHFMAFLLLWPLSLFAQPAKTAFYAEYKSMGPGAAAAATTSDPTGGRVSWSRQLSDLEAGLYTVENILGGWVKNLSL